MLNIVTIVGKEAEKVFRNLRNKYGREMSAIFSKPNEASQQKNNVKKISSVTLNSPRKSVVTGRPAGDMNPELMSRLEAQLAAKMDEDQLYADL